MYGIIAIILPDQDLYISHMYGIIAIILPD
jgi:hypothetical protein